MKELVADSIDDAEDVEGVGMTPDELEREIQGYIDEAIEFVENEIADHREESARYYRGDEDIVDYEPGRSKMVSYDLLEAIQAYLPSLMRIFHASGKLFEFSPRYPEDVAGAEQATDYLNYVYNVENDGFFVSQAAIKDALHKVFGVVKVWYDDSIEVKTHHFEGLSEDQYRAILMEPGVSAVAAESYPDPALPEQVLSQLLMTGAEIPQKWDCEIRRQTPNGRIRVEAVPGEEFLIDPQARSIVDATFVGHRRLMTVSDLVAMGYDEDDVREHLSAGDRLTYERSALERQRFVGNRGSLYYEPDDRVLYVEAYVKIDYDGDGIAELRRVCAMGPGYEVVANEPWDYRPFAHFVIDPEPHTFNGHDLFDKTKDIQRTNTAMIRGALDSLAMTLNPRQQAVEGQVNLQDAQNREIGSIVRVRQPGMLQNDVVPFMGKEALPLMDRMDQKKEDRLGISRASNGLNADALQSSTLEAVNATTNKAQEKLELAARNLAQGFQQIGRIMLKVATQNPSAAKMVRLRNEWVEIKPDVWNSDMDVVVNVGLGSGTPMQKMGALSQVLQIQQTAMQQLGPSNPLVGLGQVRHTLKEMLAVMGYQDTAQFFKSIEPNYEPPPAPETPDPALMLAQAQIEVEQGRLQLEMQKLQLDRLKAADLSDRERDRLIADVYTKLEALDAKYAHDVDLALIKSELDAQR